MSRAARGAFVGTTARRARVGALVVSALLATSAACVGPVPDATPQASSAAFTGEPLRVVMPIESASGRFAEGSPAALDPHRDWPGPFDTAELMRCCLARTLLSTNGQPVDRGGARLRPDLAAALPEISRDGLTWTFRIKQGLHYAPPLADVEITAADFIRSLHRLLAPGHDDEYAPTLLLDILGAAEYRAGDAASIAGFETPDRHTLLIRLTKPAGDLAARLATPWAVPIPANSHAPNARFGVAEGHENDYGRYFVASGPYMIEGSEALDFSLPPRQQKPVAGLVPGRRVSLVRNPSWGPLTDDLRTALPSRIELVVVTTVEEAVGQIASGAADLMAPAPVQDAERVRANPELGQVHINEAGTQGGVTLNVAQPPFDDVHVRKAVSHAIDKTAVVDALGGSLSRRVGHHVVPDSMLDNLLIDYRPYGRPDGSADLAAAKAEMAQSAYDTDGDGVCDADACRSALVAFPDFEGSIRMRASVGADLAQIGIELQDAHVDPFEALQDPSLQVAVILPHGWGRDYLSASNFFVGQFYSPVALNSGVDVGNGSLVGASPEQLAQWGYGVTAVPNVDSRVEACVPLTGAAQFECWAALDQYLMENVVSSIPCVAGVVPVLAARRVAGYTWDELALSPAYDRIQLDTDMARPPSTPLSTPAGDRALEGLWETPRLTRESMAETLTAAGLDPGAVEMIAEGESFDEYIVYQLEIGDGRWAIYGSPDGWPADIAWLGTYEVPETGRVTATDLQTSCTFSYAYQIAGDQMSINLIDALCSDEDELFQTVIFESAPFTRIR